MYIFGYKIGRFWPKIWEFFKIVKTSSKGLYLKPTNQKWWCLVKKCGLDCEKLILTKNVHFRLQNWPFLTQNVGIFQNRLNFLKRTSFEGYKPKMVMFGEEMRPGLRKNWFQLKMYIFGYRHCPWIGSKFMVFYDFGLFNQKCHINVNAYFSN